MNWLHLSCAVERLVYLVLSLTILAARIGRTVVFSVFCPSPSRATGPVQLRSILWCFPAMFYMVCPVAAPAQNSPGPGKVQKIFARSLINWLH